jgi:hypothetical protein
MNSLSQFEALYEERFDRFGTNVLVMTDENAS